MNELSQIISLTLPVLLPGLVLIIVLKSKLFATLGIPIDMGASLNGKRIFGNNKTLKGVVVMASVAILVSYLLFVGYNSGFNIYINPIFSKSPILIGIMYSFSYIFGELINSFIKRQLDISSGKIIQSKFQNLQVFFDLSDGIIVVMIALIIFTSASVIQVLIAGFIGVFFHYSTDALMKRLSLK